jgi:phage/plasmid-associated DNA primase
MGDDNTPRTVKELFRGKDIMYKVSLINSGKNESFIVNQNHILSLKSKEKIVDVKLCNVVNNDAYKNYKLYNCYGEQFSFSLEKLSVDNYYGFELDCNHRYLTSDSIVHHNSNGKSSLLELAKTVLGNYGAKVSMSILTEQRNNSGSANEQMMAYKKARLAFYSETNKQEEINTAVVKELTSQESISSRGIYQSQTIFRPKCNHVITTNYFPVVKTTDYGIWRRMKLYRHKIQFKPKNKIDLNNKYEKLADENIAREFSYNKKIKEAFLSLLVEYYKDLYNNHGGKLSNIICESLEKDSLEYRNSMDTLNRFICQNVVVSKGSKVNINEVVEAYSSYLISEFGKNTQIYKNELKQLVENSELRNFYKATNTGKIEYEGIRLIDTNDEDERLTEGEYFLSNKQKNLEGNTLSEDLNYDNNKDLTFDPLGLNDWYKNNC